jgi:hypothetical protein
MRGKAEPRGTVAARDHAGTEAKAQALFEALKRVTAALRQFDAQTVAKSAREAVAASRSAQT